MVLRLKRTSFCSLAFILLIASPLATRSFAASQDNANQLATESEGVSITEHQGVRSQAPRAISTSNKPLSLLAARRESGCGYKIKSNSGEKVEWHFESATHTAR